ncbi:MAG: methyltransferase domain-containing protein [Methanothrix sp.]|jgi:SAM-dependent methyltransferase|nr:methyltransferase domain-containing protein [Methanothrix sp.]
MSDTPAWLYDETQQIGTDYEDLSEIRAYDRRMAKIRDVAKELGEVIDLLDLSPEATVLELGCGTGEFPIAAVSRCSRVIGADISEPMLRYARKKARERLREEGRVGDLDRIEYVRGGFLTYEHESEPLDAVVTQFALHHLSDFWKQVALIRIAGMLKPGGRLFIRDVVYSFDPADYEGFFGRYLSRMAELGGEGTPQDILVHIRDEHSTIGWMMEGMIERAGFSIERADYRAGFIASYLCVKEGR